MYHERQEDVNYRDLLRTTVNSGEEDVVSRKLMIVF